MKIISLFGKVIIRTALVPVLMVLLVCQGTMRLVVNMYSLFKWVIGILCGMILIGTVIWFRQDYMRYVLIVIVEAALAAVLIFGAFTEALLGTAAKIVSRKIMGGF